VLLSTLPDTFAVCRLQPDDPWPAWLRNGAFFSITRTPDELSIVCPVAAVPETVQAERGWRCLKVEGPLDFTLTGVLSSLLTPLAAAGISVYALSTYDTDYLLLKQDDFERSLEVLAGAGHRIRRGEDQDAQPCVRCAAPRERR
jgi:hypothetical protein